MFRGGPVIDGGMHRHAAFQVAIAPGDVMSMVDSSGTVHRGAALLVPPMVWHRMLATEDLLTFFVEPHSRYADRWRAHSPDGITAVPALSRLREANLRSACGRPSQHLDPRLQKAMTEVTRSGLSITELADTVGLSPQRLRALARDQLGMPLVRWRLWRRLAHAADALIAGSPLAEAALAGGFTDQAHFSRQMRVMMGLTPAQVRWALGQRSRRAT